MSTSCTTADALIQYYSLSPELSMQCLNLLGSSVSPNDLDILRYLKYFFATVLMEMPFYGMGIFYFLRMRMNILKFINVNVLLNLATHPLVCFAFPLLAQKMNWSYADYLAVSEIFAPLVEGIILAIIFKRKFLKLFSIAALANLFSWNVGALLVN